MAGLMHDADCDVNDYNPDGIRKPCNCGAHRDAAAAGGTPAEPAGGDARPTCKTCGQVINKEFKPLYDKGLIYRPITGGLNARCPRCSCNMRHLKVVDRPSGLNAPRTKPSPRPAPVGWEREMFAEGYYFECQKCGTCWRLET